MAYSKGTKTGTSGLTNMPLYPNILRSNTIIEPLYRCILPLLPDSRADCFRCGHHGNQRCQQGRWRAEYHEVYPEVVQQLVTSSRSLLGKPILLNTEVTSSCNQVFLVSEDIDPNLAKVALRPPAAQSTSASTERNWTLWGRVNTSAQIALGLERAKKLIMFCFNDHCHVAELNDFHVLLATVETLLSEESSEAAKEAVAGLHESAAEAGGAAAAAAAITAAVAKGAQELALGADVAPPAATSEAEGHADGCCG